MMWFRREARCSHDFVAETAWCIHSSDHATLAIRCRHCRRGELVRVPRNGPIGLVDRAAVAEEEVRKYGT